MGCFVIVVDAKVILYVGLCNMIIGGGMCHFMRLQRLQNGETLCLGNCVSFI